MLADGTQIHKGAGRRPIFAIQHLGKVDEDEMYSTFNMGIGMVVMVKRIGLMLP